MLKPIPRKILTHAATLREPAADSYGVVSYVETKLSKVHIQHINTIVKSRDNKEVLLSATLFADGKLSVPLLDWVGKQKAAESANAQLKIKFGNSEYTVFSVDYVPDDEGNLHHYEVNLI